MGFAKRLANFWLLILTLGILGYICAFNLSPIYVVIPGFGEFRLAAAIVFACCFAAGAASAAIYFFLDYMKTTLLVRAKNKQIKALEAKLAAFHASQPHS